MKHIFAGLLFILMCGCASQPVQTNYDPLTQARIRAYKGGTTYFYPNAACASRNRKDGFGATDFTIPNHIVGMPIPKNAPYSKTTFDSISEMLGYVPFNEYIVAANKAITIQAYLILPNSSQISGFQGGSVVTIQNPSYFTCEPVFGTFTPQAGKDYEVYLARPNCEFRMREIVLKNGEVTALPISYTPSSYCK